MSNEKEDDKRRHKPTAAEKKKPAADRIGELLKQTKNDRKKTAYLMRDEGYSPTEIGSAFKEATGKGLSGQTWAQWKREDQAAEDVGKEAGPVLERREKAWMTTTLGRFKKLTDRVQAHIIEYGTYVYETIVPQVPADRPEDKVRNTEEWLRAAVEAFDPEKIQEIERFGATAFLAACQLKQQMTRFMSWADPSSRLQEMAMKCLYSPNPINEQAFNRLMSELMKTIYDVPRFGAGPKVEEMPGIINAYAEARGVPPEVAEKRMSAVVREVGESV